MFNLIPESSDLVLVQSDLSRRWLDWRNGCFVQQLLGMESLTDLREDIAEAGPSTQTDWENWILDLFGDFAVFARVPSDDDATESAPSFYLLGRTGLKGDRLNALARTIQHFEDAEYSIEGGTYRGIRVNALRWEGLAPEIEVRYSILKGIIIFSAGPGGDEIEKILDRYLEAPDINQADCWAQILDHWSDAARLQAGNAAWGLACYRPQDGSQQVGIRWNENESSSGGFDAFIEVPGGPMAPASTGSPLRFIPASSPLTLVLDQARLTWILDELVAHQGEDYEGLEEWVQTARDRWVGEGLTVGVGGWKPFFRKAPMEMPMPVIAIPCTDEAAAIRSLLDMTLLINRWNGWSLKMLGHGLDGRLVYRWEEREGGRPSGLLAFPRAAFLDRYLVIAWHPEVMEQVLQLYERGIATLASRVDMASGLGVIADFDALGAVIRPLVQLTAMASSFSDDPDLEPMRELNMADVVPVIEAFRCLGMVEATGQKGAEPDADLLRVSVRRDQSGAPTSLTDTFEGQAKDRLLARE
jgi:hypothetical protein